MKRLVFSILFILLCSNILYAPISASELVNQAMLISETLYLDVYEDQKVTGEKIIANPLFDNVEGQLQVFWAHIYITPFHDQKDVCLKMERFSSAEGTIRDLRLNNDHTITFQIAPSIYILDPGSERNINVWCKLSEDNKSLVDINASMTFWSNILNKKVVKEWKQAKEPKFTLPYNTVF